VLQFDSVRQIFKIAIVCAPLLAAAYGQQAGTPAKSEFEAASIRVNPPRTGFHFQSDSGTGGPGTESPGMFRCGSCTLAALIGKAFDLQNYQFPGRTSLGDNTFNVIATIPADTTPEQFRAMLQNLLKERFGLTYHYSEKNLRGYQLVVAKGGSKLKESTGGERPAAPEANSHSYAQGGSHAHAGLVNFGGSASYRADHRTTADLARVLADQVGGPVEDRTGLTGTYDIALTWSADAPQSGNHSEGNWGHGDHGGGAPAGSMGSGPALFDALPAQLGLKLVRSEQTAARIFAIDHVAQLPTPN
jgi:uncharacterized protein (TIGR03435 family)